MTEAAAIARSGGPVTLGRLTVDLRRLGVEEGMTLLVHVSLSSIGWISGGARTFIEALLQVVGPQGTIVMPAQSSELSDPAGWCEPPVPESWWETIRVTMPAYDVHLTPTRNVGIVAETFRHWPGVRRSLHPQVSFTALGPDSFDILSTQPLEDPFGASSPLAVMNRLGAHVLMVGTGWDTCTALHLAERLADPGGPTFEDGAPLQIEGERRWVRFRLPVVDCSRFPAVGAGMDGSPDLHHGHVGAATARLFSMPVAIDRARAAWSSPDVQASMPS
ncbi:aminoglycoside N(3)-acetyltransferase [Gluconobacter morbifer]|uniref:Aminoglycoside N(3)-acetyltransferase n=1 Tax=Gluconobacter morbifer G707 TaxID=1088869 RepID=G6XF20_9PROT|nr:AAC(3) family N-acetyltransferase [Gluconobacter morbifer]EHH68778.1 aminoglycoside N3-acetyltransferase [Gluconobacter morbifer G707]